MQKLEQRTQVLEQRLTEQQTLLTTASQIIRARVSTVRASVRRTHRLRTKTAPAKPGPGPATWTGDSNKHGPAPRRATCSARSGAGRRRRRNAATLGKAAAGWATGRAASRSLHVAPAPRRTRGCRPPRRARAQDRRRDERQLPEPSCRGRFAPGSPGPEAAEPDRDRARAEGRAGRVVVSAPGVLRGFDAMHVSSNQEKGYALCAGDGCVPYTTSLLVVPCYDEHAVACTLDADFRANGAPLVLRVDRAKAHTAPAVLEVCQGHGVLLLQGPPRHPCFYGQLERQNRDRRARLDLGRVGRPTTSCQCSSRRVLLNNEWRRRSLNGNTAAENWACSTNSVLRSHRTARGSRGPHFPDRAHTRRACLSGLRRATRNRNHVEATGALACGTDRRTARELTQCEIAHQPWLCTSNKQQVNSSSTEPTPGLRRRREPFPAVALGAAGASASPIASVAKRKTSRLDSLTLAHGIFRLAWGDG